MTTPPIRRPAGNGASHQVFPPAGRYRLDPSHTVVAFRTRHLFGLGAVSGTMAVTGGEITIDPAVPQASVTATISAASVRTGNRARDRDVRARFLHTGQYPDITFQAATLSRAEDGWVLAGELEVRGVSRPVTLVIESVEAAGAGFRARAAARIDRYAFGVTAAKGMAARYLDISLTAVAAPPGRPAHHVTGGRHRPLTEREGFQMSASLSEPGGQASSPRRPVRDKVVVITGASSGVGLETAKQLAGQGGEIVMIARDQARGEHARSQVAEAAAGKPPVLLTADLSVQADVRRVAHKVRDRYGHVDILINNAGAAFSRREQSPDGLELTWATNHLAPFLLTELLLPLLVAAPAGRIVNVVSEFYGRKLNLGNLQGERKYNYFGAYRASKLGEVLFTTELARRIQGSGVTVVSVSPGPAKTNFAVPSGVLGVVLGVMQRTPLFKPAGQAAEGIAWAATAPELTGHSGALYMRGKQLSLKGSANNPSLAAQVWRISEQQTGVDPARSAVAAVSAADGPDPGSSRLTNRGPDGPGS